MEILKMGSCLIERQGSLVTIKNVYITSSTQLMNELAFPEEHNMFHLLRCFLLYHLMNIFRALCILF